MRVPAILLLLTFASCILEPQDEGSRAGWVGEPVSRADVEKLVSGGVSEAVILEMIDRSGATPLGSDDIVALKQAGATDAVLRAMIASARTSAAPARVPYRHAGHHGGFSTHHHHSGYSRGVARSGARVGW